MKRLALSVVIFILAVSPMIGHTAYVSNICKGTICEESEVGPFMKDISKECGNLGTCSLDDILTVFANVGNFVIGIIGGLVLLMYVVGGFHLLISGGRKDYIDKGKKYMTISTAGLLVVMFSYLIIYAIRGTIQYGNVFMSDTEDYVACTGIDTYGLPCDINSTCTANGCESKCRQTYPNFSIEEDGMYNVVTYHDCVDTADASIPSSDVGGNFWYDSATCQKGYCPGSDANICCQVHSRY